MPVLVRCWVGLAALGAGLIHLGVAASAGPAALAVLTVVGCAELAWAVAALARSVLPLPRIVPIGAIVPAAAWVVLLLAGAHHAGTGMSVLPAGPLLMATALDLVPALVVAVRLRRGLDPAGEAGPMPAPLPYLAGVLVGSFLAAGATITALAGTEVGRLALQGGMPGM